MTSENLKIGRLFFIEDDFFNHIGDEYLKVNKDDTQRPHYYSFKDDKTNLYWAIPCSSKVEKYERIIEQKKKNKRPHNHIQIIKISGIKQALLYQDMFPIIDKYIKNIYEKNNSYMEIQDPKKIESIERNAKAIIKLLRHGVKFTPTQPNVLRIEEMMLKELNIKLHN